MWRDAADTNFAASILYFPEILRKPAVFFTTAAFSVEVLTQ